MLPTNLTLKGQKLQQLGNFQENGIGSGNFCGAIFLCSVGGFLSFCISLLASLSCCFGCHGVLGGGPWYGMGGSLIPSPLID